MKRILIALAVLVVVFALVAIFGPYTLVAGILLAAAGGYGYWKMRGDTNDGDVGKAMLIEIVLALGIAIIIANALLFAAKHVGWA